MFLINNMKIITSVVNTIHIEAQFLSLKKFLNNNFEYIIFNDAKNFNDLTNNNDSNAKNKVREKCKELNIKCIDHNNDYHINIKSGSFRHASVLQIMLDYQKNNPDHYLYIDCDMYLLDYLDITKYYNYQTAIVLQHRVINNFNVNYMWPGLCYFNNNVRNIDLLNWNLANGCDTGGMTRKWLLYQNNNDFFPSTLDIRHADNIEDYHTVNIYFIKHLWAGTWNIDELSDNFKNNTKFVELLKSDKRNKNNNISCEIYDNVFLHYRGGSGWELNCDIDFPNKIINIFNLKNN